jgi:COP9 signalosome complex subunit 5
VNKYWVATLSQSPLVVNRGYAAGQVADLAEKLARADGATRGKSQTTAPLKEENAQLARGERVAKLKEEIARREEDAPLAKAARDG